MTALFPIPASWAWTTLGEIAEVVGGVTKDTKKQSDPALPEVPYLRVANVQRGYLDLREITKIRVPESTLSKLRLLPGDVLLNEGGDRDKLGRGWVWDGQIPDCIHQNHVFRARLPKDTVLPRFLAWYVNYPARQWFDEHAAQSVNLASISLSTIRQLPVPVAPLDEQHRIVFTLDDHLSRVDAGSVYLNQASKQESQLRIAIYTAAVEGRLIASTQAGVPITKRFHTERQSRWRKEHGNRKYKLPVEPDLEIEPSVPDSWHVVSLEAATDPARLIQYGILMPRVKIKGSVPYVEVKDLAGETLSGKNLRRTSRELDEQFSKSRLAKNDVVMAVRGSYERSAVVPEDLEGANVSRDVVRIAPLTDLDPDYLHIYLQSAFSRRYFAHHARGVAVKGVNTASVRSLPVVIPALEVQHEIVREVSRFISAVNKVSTEISYARKRASNFRESLLAEAFAGRLAPQDPTDEPVAVLLERIRAEQQAAQPRERKGRRTPKQTPQEEILL
jgi:type I restriction enzyme, S subunit